MEDLGIDTALIAERERLDGRRAVAFLEQLPGLVAYWQQRLGLEGARIMPGGVLSGVFACRLVGGGEPVVLKLAAEGSSSSAAEAAALRAWGGSGACALRFASDDARVMLLDMVLPGTAVRPGDEADDVRRAAELLGRLHLDGTPPAEVPDATAELRWRYDRAHTMLDGSSHARGVLSHARIDEAFAAALALHRDAPNRVLLHGDFIAKNLLLGPGGEWCAIDPRPCAGDPCLDAAFWALAYRPGVAVPDRCAAVAAAAGLDPERVWAWARAFAVSEAVLVRDADRSAAHAAVARL